jgi:hypothetical protein
MSKTTRVLIPAALLCAFLTVYGCTEQEKKVDVDALSASYQKGYQEGYDTGYLQGDFDYERNNERDNTPPMPQGDYDRNYRTGFSDGYLEGYDKGWGAKLATNPLYKKGYSDGFSYGADKGYMDYMKDEASPGFNVEVSGQVYKNYRIGYEKGAEDGYRYGVEQARNGKSPPQDWYADYAAGSDREGGGESAQSGSESSSTSKELSDYVPGGYTHDSWADDHFEYNLSIFGDFRFEMSLYPKGGQVVNYVEEGRCEVNNAAATLTFNPSEIYGERPAELELDRPWKIELEYEGDFVLVILIDGNGNKWPSKGLESR